VALVDPPALFTFQEEDAWPENCSTGRGTGIDAVPPPPGLFINACPNPAPSGTFELVIEFTLEVSVPGVNIAVVNAQGEIVSILMRDQIVSANSPTSVSWFLDGVPPGDYRAYFRAGQLETSGDLQVQ
jgi:hypothetical protein